VAIALVLEAHESHDDTLEALDGRLLGLAGHAWFETYSVLTRLPPPTRRRPQDVASILAHNFPESRFLTEEAAAELSQRLAVMELSGGAVYDALVGHAAVIHGLGLASRDRRALETYRAVGASVEMIS
jgi:hypothetical protein